MGSKVGGARFTAAGTAISLLGALGLSAMVQPAHAATTTVSHDADRDAWDPDEPGLGPADVTSSDFGQVFSTQLDGQVYAEPIVADGVLVAVTENNNVYGLDPQTGKIVWGPVNTGPAWPASAVACGDLTPNIGITGTPVFDPVSNAVYFTSKTYTDGSPQEAHWYMHALDPTTGAEKPNWPVEIKGAPVNDPGDDFNAFRQMQRPGLLLMDGVVYTAFGAHCDYGSYHGYVVGVSTAKASITSMWATEPSTVSNGAGVWQAGGGLVSDGPGQILLSTGNGVSPSAGPGKTPPGTLAESVVRLQVNPVDQSLSAVDFFSPSNNATLDLNDTDLGSGGPVALPDSFGTASVPHLLVQEGKDGRVFLLNRDNLGGMAQGPNGTDAAVAVIGPFAGQWGHPAVWGGDGGYVYMIGSNAPLRAFQAGVTADGTPTLVPVGTSADILGYTSGSPTVTSHGTDSGSAVVWVVSSSGASGANGQLHAYSPIPDATGKLPLLYSAPIGTAAKFANVATDGNRVFIGTRDGKVLSFGRPTTSAVTASQASFGNVAVGSSGQQQVTLTATAAVTVNGATSNSSQFTVGAVPPTPLTPGQQMTIPVTFQPTGPGSASAVLSVATSAGTVGVVLNGNGTRPGLAALPGSVAFDTDQPTGSSAVLPVRITNTGTDDETIASVSGPSGPFSATGLPTVGTVIKAQTSIDGAVTYAPTAAESDTSTIVITTAGGHTLTVPVTGAAQSGKGLLTFSTPSLGFGDVRIGTTSTLGFDVTNTGNMPLTITKAKAPTGIFSVPQQISEGMVLGPGQSLHQDVVFAPSAGGTGIGRYEITADAGQGAMFLDLVGFGVAKPTVSRTAGGDRFGTGVAVSQSRFADAGGDSTGRQVANTVVLARGDDFPDALAGVPLAAKVDAPLLLTDTAALTPVTEAEIRRVLGGSGTVDILGGPGAVSPAVEARLVQLGYSVNRYWGPDRYATALDIARRGLGDPAHIILATGLGYADALAAGPFAAGPAASNGTPAAILLTNGSAMDPATAAYVRTKAAGSTPSSVSIWAVGTPAVKASAAAGGYVIPLAGGDRYATDAAVVNATTAAGPVYRVAVATGDGFPDALTGGALAAETGAVLVTVPSTLTPSISAMLTAMAPNLSWVRMFGGTSVLGPAIQQGLVQAVNQ